MTDYLVDNSVWARLAAGDAGVAARLRRIERAPADLFVTCPPQVLEFCHSARTPEEHAAYRERISLGFPLERAPDEALVLDIQAALRGGGLVRAADAPRHSHRRLRHRQRCHCACRGSRLRAYRSGLRPTVRVHRTIAVTCPDPSRSAAIRYRLTTLEQLCSEGRIQPGFAVPSNTNSATPPRGAEVGPTVNQLCGLRGSWRAFVRGDPPVTRCA